MLQKSTNVEMMHADKLTKQDIEIDRLRQEINRLHLENEQLQRMREMAPPVPIDSSLQDKGPLAQCVYIQSHAYKMKIPMTWHEAPTSYKIYVILKCIELEFFK